MHNRFLFAKTPLTRPRFARSTSPGERGEVKRDSLRITPLPPVAASPRAADQRQQRLELRPLFTRGDRYQSSAARFVTASAPRCASSAGVTTGVPGSRNALVIG
jgi:hypothetical protein